MTTCKFDSIAGAYSPLRMTRPEGVAWSIHSEVGDALPLSRCHTLALEVYDRLGIRTHDG